MRRAAECIDLLKQCHSLLLELSGESLHVIAAREGISSKGSAALVPDHLLRSQRQRCGLRAGEGQGFIIAIGVK